MIARILTAWFLLLCMFSTSLAEQPLVWLEAEQFSDLGGWVNDAQFIDQMGSPYLLAIGMGTPVQDASTSVMVPNAAKYRLWVRAKDWLPE